MQYQQGSIIDTIHAVKGYVTQHADRLGAIATSGACRKLDEVAITLDAHGREQEAQKIEAGLATQRRVELRQALIHDHMQPIARVAEEELQNYSELSALHMPRLNVSDQSLIQKARAMASASTSYADTFTTTLGDIHFVASLESAADALVAATKGRSDSITNRQKATAGLKSAAGIAKTRLRVLDSMVKKVVKKDPALLAAWNRAKQIAKKPGMPRTVVTAADKASAAPAVTSEPTTIKEAA